MFSGWMLLWFSPDRFQRRHIHTHSWGGASVNGQAVHLHGRGRTQTVQSFCAVLLKLLAVGQEPGHYLVLAPPSRHFVAASWLPLPAIDWHFLVFSPRSDWSDCSLWTLRRSSAHISRWATSSSLTSSRLITRSCSVDVIRHLDLSEKEAFRSLFDASLRHHSQILPEFPSFRSASERDCHSHVCLGPSLSRICSILSLRPAC